MADAVVGDGLLRSGPEVLCTICDFICDSSLIGYKQVYRNGMLKIFPIASDLSLCRPIRARTHPSGRTIRFGDAADDVINWVGRYGYSLNYRRCSNFPSVH
jgi:hypothetical protein